MFNTVYANTSYLSMRRVEATTLAAELAALEWKQDKYCYWTVKASSPYGTVCLHQGLSGEEEYWLVYRRNGEMTCEILPSLKALLAFILRRFW